MAEHRSHMPVTLEVELARFPVPLADLARLEAGAVLPLPVDRRGLVVLRAGEHAIARGELVDVDGAVGVRILSLEGQP
jgi:type III secretion protein Q